MSFSTRIWTALGIIGLVMATSAGIFVHSSRVVLEDAVRLTDDALPGVYTLGRLSQLTEELQKKMMVDLTTGASPATSNAEWYIDALERQFRNELSG